MKARIVSYSVDGELKFSTVTNCCECYYDTTGRYNPGTALCVRTNEYILSDNDPENCSFPTVLDVLIAKDIEIEIVK